MVRCKLSLGCGFRGVNDGPEGAPSEGLLGPDGQVHGVAALLYASAGTVVWPAGWVFLAIFFGGGMTVVLLLARNDPEFVAERRERIAC